MREKYIFERIVRKLKISSELTELNKEKAVKDIKTKETQQKRGNLYYR